MNLGECNLRQRVLSGDVTFEAILFPYRPMLTKTKKCITNLTFEISQFFENFEHYT